MSTAAATVTTPTPSSRRQAFDAVPTSAPELHRFLTRQVPDLVASAVQSLLPAGTGQAGCTVTRTKLKPGRKLSVYGELTVPGTGPRPYAATWVDPAGATGSTARVLVPARLAAPFTSLTAALDGAGASLALAPWDPAFPQLLGLYDAGHLAHRLTAAGLGTLDESLRVTPVRYRPGQRHVLRVLRADPRRPGYYAKCYRDDTGRRAITASRQVGAALAAWGGPARAAHAAGYLEAERAVLWAQSPGTPLSTLVGARPELARTAGAALRAVHDSLGVFGADGSGHSDPTGEARATSRSAEHVTALDPAAGAELATLLDRACALLEGDGEHGHRLHGDFKADNILVAGDSLVLLDFDRVTVGDPALDLGKFRADLRWWALGTDRTADSTIAAFLEGYGPAPGARLHRAQGYDALFQLRAVGRRVLLHEPDWSDRVRICLQEAARTLGGGP